MNLQPSFSTNRRPLLALSVILIVFIAAVILLVKHQNKISINPAFSKYIESYTSGVISRSGTIRIKLSGQVQTSHAQNQQLDDGMFSFS
jgi:hypothetical protein